MTCAELEVLLCDYVDGTLAAKQRALVESHLESCASCSEATRDAAGAVAFLERAAAVYPPDELVTRILFQAPRGRSGAGNRGLRARLGRWIEPVLQPRFAMGMAMTILSFSLLGRFAGIPDRPLKPSDLEPAKVWAAIDDRAHRAWDRAVKYYENLRLVYEIQTRLREWTEEEERDRRLSPGGPAAEPTGTQNRPDPRDGAREQGERRIER